MSDKQWLESPKEAVAVCVCQFDQGSEYHEVGKRGITRIVRVPREGLHSNIPYIEVWCGDVLFAEFCQHAVQGVYWTKHPEATVSDDLPF